MQRQPCDYRNHDKAEALAGMVKYETTVNGKSTWDDGQKARCQCCAGWFHINDTVASMVNVDGQTFAYHYCDLCWNSNMNG